MTSFTASSPWTLGPWTSYASTSRADAKRIARECAGVEPSLLAPSESSVVRGYEDPERGRPWKAADALDRFDDLEVDLAVRRATYRFDCALAPFETHEVTR
jgi:hypothetical protein